MLLYSAYLSHVMLRHSVVLYSIHVYNKTGFCVSFVTVSSDYLKDS